MSELNPTWINIHTIVDSVVFLFLVFVLFCAFGVGAVEVNRLCAHRFVRKQFIYMAFTGMISGSSVVHSAENTFSRKYLLAIVLWRECCTAMGIVLRFILLLHFTPHHFISAKVRWMIVDLDALASNFPSKLLSMRRGFDPAKAETMEAEIELIHCVEKVFLFLRLHHRHRIS